jgi:hypothetical protein
LVRLPRTTGALSGFLVLLLGVWAGLIPFVGPYFDFGFAPDEAWHYSSSRLWLVILPAVAAVLGGLMMILASRRPSGAIGGWLAVAGGAWLIVGPSASLFWQSKMGIGDPLGGQHRQAVEWIACFYGVGALIVALAAFATGRFLSRPQLTEEAAAAPADRESRPAPTAAETSAGDRVGATEREPADEREAATGPPATEGTDAPERQPVEHEASTAQPRATARSVDDEPPPERTTTPQVRRRRRQGGLVGRLLGRRSGS